MTTSEQQAKDVLDACHLYWGVGTCGYQEREVIMSHTTCKDCHGKGLIWTIDEETWYGKSIPLWHIGSSYDS